MQALFGKKLTPKEQAMQAKRDTRKEVRVSEKWPVFFVVNDSW